MDVLLEGMDDTSIQFARNPDSSVNRVGQFFVDDYFNARRIGGSSSGGEEEEGGGTTSPLENPPAPNP